MRLHSNFCLALLALPLALGLESQPRFAPAEETSLTVTFEQQSKSELVDNEFTFEVNGEEQEGMEAPEIEITRSFTERVVFTDEFTSADDERPTKVQRVFDEVTSTSIDLVTDPEGEEHESEDVKSSELTGIALLFDWDDDDEEYSASFADEDEEADEELLETLEFTGYLAEFLPEDEVSEGDDWELEAGAFRTLIYPGGDLSYVSDDEEEEDEDEGEGEDDSEEDWDAQYNDNLSGDVVLEHKGTREVDGVELLVIGVTMEVETSVEKEEEITVEINEEEGEGTTTDTYTFTFELEGELLWNEEAGHLVSLDLAGDTTFELVELQEMAAGGVEIVVTETQSFEGTNEYHYTVE